jgi:hypothetical protein
MTNDIYDRIDKLKAHHFKAALDALWARGR